ncbi:MGMT family protein [Tepidiforma flava]|uniref:MGMT family protein n=1 Tax=Tepidiforma flava TaxID=3004094 RepID=UPI0035709EE0
MPAGEVRSYAWLAEAAGLGRANARAAGAIIGANPVPLWLPCHRVVASRRLPPRFRRRPRHEAPAPRTRRRPPRPADPLSGVACPVRARRTKRGAGAPAPPSPAW